MEMQASDALLHRVQLARDVLNEQVHLGRPGSRRGPRWQPRNGCGPHPFSAPVCSAAFGGKRRQMRKRHPAKNGRKETVR